MTEDHLGATATPATAHPAAPPADPPASSTIPADMRTLPKDAPADWTDLERSIVGVLKDTYDPEIPVDIWELGLIYVIATSPDGAHVHVDMTLTSPMCPVAGTLPPDVQRKINGLPGVMTAEVEVIWEPPWDMNCMSEAAKLQLNVG